MKVYGIRHCKVTILRGVGWIKDRMVVRGKITVAPGVLLILHLSYAVAIDLSVSFKKRAIFILKTFAIGENLLIQNALSPFKINGNNKKRTLFILKTLVIGKNRQIP